MLESISHCIRCQVLLAINSGALLAEPVRGRLLDLRWWLLLDMFPQGLFLLLRSRLYQWLFLHHFGIGNSTLGQDLSFVARFDRRWPALWADEEVRAHRRRHLGIGVLTFRLAAGFVRKVSARDAAALVVVVVVVLGTHLQQCLSVLGAHVDAVEGRLLVLDGHE